MKFKDLPSGEIFTYWEHDKHHTAIKIGERGTAERERAVCLESGEIVDVHHNKDVKELDKIDETLEYKVGRDGQAFLCSPMTEGKMLAHRVILIGSEIMNEKDLKTVSRRKDGGERNADLEVYIMMQTLERKIKELETLFAGVKMLLQENLSLDSSDNRIMSTMKEAKRLLLTE